MSSTRPEPRCPAAGLAAACPVRLEAAAAGHRIGFAASGAELAAWPREYLDPVFSFAPAGVLPRPTVAAIADDRLHRELRALVLESGPGEPARTYEDTPARRHRTADGGFALAYRDRPGVTLVDRGAGAVAFVTASRDREAPFEAARLLREVLRRRLEAEGGVVLHAGAVELGGSVWLACGPKFAGKTTLVCALVERLGAPFVANDRVFLGRAAAGPLATAWPMSVRIGLGTCLASPGLRPWLRPGTSPRYPQVGWDPERGLGEDGAARLAARPGAPKLELVPAELVGSLGGAVVAGGRLGGVLLPARDPDLPRGAARSAPVSPEAALSRMRGELLTPEDDDYPDWLGLRTEAPRVLRAAALELLGSVASHCPVIEVSFRTGAEAASAVESHVSPLAM